MSINCWNLELGAIFGIRYYLIISTSEAPSAVHCPSPGAQCQRCWTQTGRGATLESELVGGAREAILEPLCRLRNAPRVSCTAAPVVKTGPASPKRWVTLSLLVGSWSTSHGSGIQSGFCGRDCWLHTTICIIFPQILWNHEIQFSSMAWVLQHWSPCLPHTSHWLSPCSCIMCGQLSDSLPPILPLRKSCAGDSRAPPVWVPKWPHGKDPLTPCWPTQACLQTRNKPCCVCAVMYFMVYLL